jgi:hypothetical protein
MPDLHSAKWIAVYALGLLSAGIAILLKPVLPEFSRREWIGIGLASVLVLAHLFWFQPSGFEFSLLGRISFFALFWISWRGFTSQLRWGDFWWPLGIGIALYSAYGLYCLKMGIPFERRAGAGALGAALALWWAIPAPKALSSRIFQPVVGALGIAIALQTNLLVTAALALSLVVLAVQALRAKSLTKAAYLPVGLTALLATLLFFGLGGRPAASPLMGEKAQVWKHSLQLIKANPLGVGVDRFDFTFPTFQRAPGGDNQLMLSPQNDFLRWFAEDGLVLGTIFLFGIFYFLRKWRKSEGRHAAVVFPVGAFFLAEMIWSSPWQSPFSMALGAVVIGCMAAGVWKRRMLPAHAGTRALLLVSWIFLLVCLGRALVSHSFERTEDVFRAKLSCRAVSSNWRACLNYGSLLLAQGETTEARREVERVLEAEPWNFVAIRHLGVIALKQGDRLEACFLSWRYDDLFGGQSELSEQYAKNCPAKWRDYFGVSG